MVMLDYLLQYIMWKSGWKLVLGTTVAYFRDLNLRTNYFSIIPFFLHAWETCHLKHDIGKVCETWGYKFALTHHLNFVIAMLGIDETPLKVGILKTNQEIFS